MKYILTLFALLWLLAQLTGCASAPSGARQTSVPERPVSATAVPPAATRAPYPGPSTPQPGSKAPRGVEVRPYVSPDELETMPADATDRPAGPLSLPRTSGAVLALLGNADDERLAGNHAMAAATLERALRIEPRNALVWHRLAEIRLQQGKPRRAESLAMKSNSLAGNDSVLRAKNRELIERARRQRGGVD
jgi:tetratricopeptide (TPR) repeat protein